VESDQELFLKWLTRFWFLLLMPWIVIAPLSGMAFDAGHTVEAYVLVGCIWAYPIVLGVSFLLKRRWPFVAAFLPLANLALPFALAAILDAVHSPSR
jgi:hypothetical protein